MMSAMDEQQQHEMVLEKTYPAGAEEWYCPTCGRRMARTWEPWKKIVLEPGDSYAVHGGGKGGLRMGPLQEKQASTEQHIVGQNLNLWLEGLEGIDFSGLE